MSGGEKHEECESMALLNTSTVQGFEGDSKPSYL
jgi:hypothetical protein